MQRKIRKKPQIDVNFNEVIEDDQILLSQTDFAKDINGNDIFLKEGLEIDIFEEDYDECNNRDDIIASGYVTRCKDPHYQHVKWKEYREQRLNYQKL